MTPARPEVQVRAAVVAQSGTVGLAQALGIHAEDEAGGEHLVHIEPVSVERKHLRIVVLRIRRDVGVQVEVDRARKLRAAAVAHTASARAVCPAA